MVSSTASYCDCGYILNKEISVLSYLLGNSSLTFFQVPYMIRGVVMDKATWLTPENNNAGKQHYSFNGKISCRTCACNPAGFYAKMGVQKVNKNISSRRPTRYLCDQLLMALSFQLCSHM